MAGIATKLVWNLTRLEQRLAPRPEPAPPDESQRAALARLVGVTDLVFAITMCVLALGLMRDVAVIYTDNLARDHTLMSVRAVDLPSQGAEIVVRSNGQEISTLQLSDINGGYLDLVARRDAANPAISFNLARMMPPLVKYLLAFGFLALFWMLHRRMFLWVQRASSALVFSNLVFVLCIVVIPFTTFFWSWNGRDDPDPFTWFLFDRQGTMVYALGLAVAAAALLMTWIAACLSRRNMHIGYQAVRWYYGFRQVLLVGALLAIFRLAARDVVAGNVALVAVLLSSVLLAWMIRYVSGWLEAFWGWLSIRLWLAINPRAARYRHL